MTKRIRWLLITISLELVAAAGLLVWVWTTASTEEQPKQSTTAQTTQPSGPPSVVPKLVTGGLKLPLTITNNGDANDKRLYVVEQGGDVRIVDTDGTLLTKPFLDIQNKVLADGEMGLLGLAFHPKFKDNGYIFVNYIDKDQNTIIARFTASKNGDAADPATEKVLIKLKQPYPNHNGGDVHFGPDGFLYIALGDGGSGGDPEDRAQNLGVMFGKLLRIDVDSGNPYTIPMTNPYRTTSGAVPEIWALGLRNPWRFSFDSQTHELYIADVGQSASEELNIQSATSKGGENYGWRCYEGNASYNLAGCKAVSTYVGPILAYDHAEGRCSITGGYVYRGKAYPNMLGKYFFADYCGKQLYYTELKNNTWTQTLASATESSISSFGQDANGELYFSDHQKGAIYRLEDTSK